PFDVSWSTAALAPRPRLAAAFGQIADALDVGLPLGHRNDPAGIEEVEGMARLEALVIGGKGEFVVLACLALGEQGFAFPFGILEVPLQGSGVGKLEIVAGIFLLRLQE